MNFISEATVEKSLTFLVNNASKAAEARANRIYMEEYRKVIKAEVMAKHLDKPLAAQEREAYASQEYKNHLKALSDSITIDERYRFRTAAEQAIIEAWRSQSANERAHKL